MKTKLPKYLRHTIDDVVRSCDLERASFSMGAAEDKKIKAAIRLWLDTWIKSPLERIQRFDNGDMDEFEEHRFRNRQ